MSWFQPTSICPLISWVKVAGAAPVAVGLKSVPENFFSAPTAARLSALEAQTLAGRAADPRAALADILGAALKARDTGAKGKGKSEG